MQVTPMMVLSGVATIIAVGGLVLTRRYWNVPGMPALAGFNFAVIIWTGGNALQILMTSLQSKLFWINVQYLGIATVPVAAFVFAAIVAGYEEWVTPKRIGLLTAPLIGLVGLSWTNPIHSLVRESATIGVLNGTIIIERTFGPAFWAGWVYSNLLLLVATILVLRTVITADVFVQRRTGALLIGAIVPWVAHLLFLVDISPFEPEPFFAITGLAFVYALIRYQQVEAAPPRRDWVIEEIDEGILGVSEAGVIVDLNSAARELLDMTNQPIIGKPIEFVFEGYPGLRDWYQSDAQNEVISLRSENGERYVDAERHWIENELGGDTEIVVLKDVTQLKNQEQELKWQYERLDKFTSVLSHDLRNPLNVAEGRLELIEETGDLDHLDTVQQAHTRMKELIDDVLYLSRTDRNVDDMERVDLAKLLPHCWQNVETGEANLKLDAEQTILADESRFVQMVENLFRNAVEHGGEAVTVTVGDLKNGFYIEDDGSGIPESRREEIFETGYSSSSEGTGLGLSIVNRIVEAHGWDLRITESAEGGARFEITGVDLAEK